MQLIIKKNKEELCLQLATWLVDYIAKTLAVKDKFTFVLSGGSTPKRLYQLLASDAFNHKIDWEKVHFFWGDERIVPFDDERNNAKMAFDNLLNHVPVLQRNIHIIQTDIPPAQSTNAYEKLLREYFPNGGQTFDLVLLGLGDNAHTLSLFPGYDVVFEKEKWVSHFYLKEQEMERITLTAPVVNKARHIAFLVTGADKKIAFEQVNSNDYQPTHYPAQMIQPTTGELSWWVDETVVENIA